MAESLSGDISLGAAGIRVSIPARDRPRLPGHVFLIIVVQGQMIERDVPEWLHVHSWSGQAHPVRPRLLVHHFGLPEIALASFPFQGQQLDRHGRLLSLRRACRPARCPSDSPCASSLDERQAGASCCFACRPFGIGMSEPNSPSAPSEPTFDERRMTAYPRRLTAARSAAPAAQILRTACGNRRARPSRHAQPRGAVAQRGRAAQQTPSALPTSRPSAPSRRARAPRRDAPQDLKRSPSHDPGPNKAPRHALIRRARATDAIPG
eukprot:238029-Chlamydomonas_euryale.AAC.15